VHSHILRIAARHLLIPFLIISLVILLRGHNQPGGGFIGGLVAAAAFILYSVAYGALAARKLLRVDPRVLIGIGLTTSAAALLMSLFWKKPLMTGMWLELDLPLIGHQHVGTPLLFDFGVYLVVIGVLLTVVYALSEEP
jgi:multicomponent Na+:H+ antiporter subunit B